MSGRLAPSAADIYPTVTLAPLVTRARHADAVWVAHRQGGATQPGDQRVRARRAVPDTARRCTRCQGVTLGHLVRLAPGLHKHTQPAAYIAALPRCVAQRLGTSLTMAVMMSTSRSTAFWIASEVASAAERFVVRELGDLRCNNDLGFAFRSGGERTAFTGRSGRLIATGAIAAGAVSSLTPGGPTRRFSGDAAAAPVRVKITAGPEPSASTATLGTDGVGSPAGGCAAEASATGGMIASVPGATRPATPHAAAPPAMAASSSQGSSMRRRVVVPAPRLASRSCRMLIRGDSPAGRPAETRLGAPEEMQSGFLFITMS